MEPVRTAVVGCGIFGETHVDAYAEDPLCELVCVCDLDESRAKRLAARHGCEWTTDFTDVAADKRVDAVSVATPDFAHVEPCVALAGAGKHLLVEKPLALSSREAEAIAAAVDDAGVIGMVDFHNRYNPAMRTIRDRLTGGEIGRPQMMYVRLSDRLEVATQWFRWAGRTGPEWFLGSHIADLACWMFDAWPSRVFAEGRKDVLAARGIDCYDSMQIHLTFPEGMATLETSWIMPDSWPMVVNFVVSVQATEGRADADLSQQGVTLADAKSYEWPLTFGNTPVGQDTFGFFRLPIRDFLRAVRDGAPSPVPMDVGVRNVRLVAAAVESVETGRIVDLPAD